MQACVHRAFFPEPWLHSQAPLSLNTKSFEIFLIVVFLVPVRGKNEKVTGLGPGDNAGQQSQLEAHIVNVSDPGEEERGSPATSVSVLHWHLEL